MTERIKMMLEDILSKKHHIYRQNIEPEEFSGFTAELAATKLSDTQRAAKRLEWVMSAEKPVILDNERIVFTRTVCRIPEIFTHDEWEELKKSHYIHEQGKICNICPDYASAIKDGLQAKKDVALEKLKSARDEGENQFLTSVISSVDAVLSLAERYAEEAEKAGKKETAQILRRVPRYGARTFHEALQSFRVIHYCLWCCFNYHNTIGRFDQYMYPYLENDLESGRLNHDEAFELLEEFFLTFNKDSDLYTGMQQGDNGQSMVLGGVDEKGQDAYNILSEMCLKASLELKVIDPKINLRVSKNTDMEIYKFATELTKQGLGFPQYSNDDAVIPGLIAKGYTPEDAGNYVVAACWEFIIPGVGMDIPNIGSISYPTIIDKAVHKSLVSCASFEAFMKEIEKEFHAQVERETERFKNIYMEPSPFMSVLMEGCIENGRDVSLGLKYNNYGLHGAGLSTAADSLAAVKKFVFDDNTVSAKELIEALEADFEGYDDLRTTLRLEAPKMGDDDDYVDDIACSLTSIFAETVKDKRNDRTGCYRAGTGSAMYYVWSANNLGATADGRKKGEYLSANYAPSLNVKTKGPVSVIRSFSKPDLSGVMNGGPLTIEMHDTVFRGSDSIAKVAMLVKFFIDRGGHQLQVNTLNRETLIEAQKNPQKYTNLIVRVWGWSGYFVELDEVYQNHIIQRVELKI